jgi:hypothetical protein
MRLDGLRCGGESGDRHGRFPSSPCLCLRSHDQQRRVQKYGRGGGGSEEIVKSTYQTQRPTAT